MKMMNPDEKIIIMRNNKMLYQAFSRQANRLTLNIPVLQGILIGRLKKMRKVDKLKIMN